jgi:lipopolysaccharide heptosyltransferase II
MARRIPVEELSKIDARRIAIIKPSALGDVVQTLPLLPVLRERFRNTHISWVINSSISNLLEAHPDLDGLIRFERQGSATSWVRLLRELRRREFDLVFDLQGLLRTAAMTLATRAPVRVGLETAREGAHLACHVTIPDTNKFVPVHARYERLFDALGMGHLQPQPRVAVTADDHAWARTQIAKLGSPTLAIHPGARWITKRWPAERFAAVACKAMRRYGFSTLILGSGDEKPVCDQVEQVVRKFSPNGSIANLAGKTSLKQLASLLASVNVVLTNDSGPMHLAAAVGTPVVGLFTCTSPVRSGPPGGQHQCVSTKLSCAASYRKRCPYRGRKHLACMEELDIDRVWQAFVRVMEANFDLSRAA